MVDVTKYNLDPGIEIKINPLYSEFFIHVTLKETKVEMNYCLF